MGSDVEKIESKIRNNLNCVTNLFEQGWDIKELDIYDWTEFVTLRNLGGDGKNIEQSTKDVNDTEFDLILIYGVIRVKWNRLKELKLRKEKIEKQIKELEDGLV